MCAFSPVPLGTIEEAWSHSGNSCMRSTMMDERRYISCPRRNQDQIGSRGALNAIARQVEQLCSIHWRNISNKVFFKSQKQYRSRRTEQLFHRGFIWIHCKGRDRYTIPISFISVFCSHEPCSGDQRDKKALERLETLMLVFFSCCEHDKYKQTSLTARDKCVLLSFSYLKLFASVKPFCHHCLQRQHEGGVYVVCLPWTSGVYMCLHSMSGIWLV